MHMPGAIIPGSVLDVLLMQTVPGYFAAVCSCDGLSCLQLTASVVEIYCERIRDLLSAEPGAGEGLAVQQDRVRGIVIPGACEVPARSEGELMRVMQLGLARRMTACTGMNAGSSRSHCVVLLRLTQAQQDGCVLHSKLCLVDLAGVLILHKRVKADNSN